MRLRGSLENWDPPPLLRFTKKALFGPGIDPSMIGIIHGDGIAKRTAYLPDEVLRHVGLQVFGHLAM